LVMFLFIIIVHTKRPKNTTYILEKASVLICSHRTQIISLFMIKNIL